MTERGRNRSCWPSSTTTRIWCATLNGTWRRPPRPTCNGSVSAFARHDLPRAVRSDDGSPVIAGERVEGLATLGILDRHSEACSRYQIARTEHFVAAVEDQPMAMLPTDPTLTLTELNDMTQARLHRECQRRPHREIDTTQAQRSRNGLTAARPCPLAETVRSAFQITVTRRVHRSDGTVSLGVVRCLPDSGGGA